MRHTLFTPLLVFVAIGNTPAQEETTITLNFPRDREVNLEVLVDFVRRNLNIPLAYDRSLLKGDSSNLTIKPASETKVSSSELFCLLNNTLKFKGLALVPEGKGASAYYTIKPIPQVRPLVPRGKAEDFTTKDIFSEVFLISKGSTAEAKAYIESFYPSGMNKPSPIFITEIAKQGELVVTGFQPDMIFIEEIVKRFNSGSFNLTRSFYVAKYIQLDELSTLLSLIVGNKVGEKQTNQELTRQSLTKLRIIKQESRNRLLLVGTRHQIADAKKALEEIDIPTELTFDTYRSADVSVKKIDELFRKFVSKPFMEKEYKSTVDETGNTLIVQATVRVHKQLKQLVTKLGQDVDTAKGQKKQGLVRTYKLKNVKAQDILDTIRAIERSALGNRHRNERRQRSLNFNNLNFNNNGRNQIWPLQVPDQTINQGGGFGTPLGINFRVQDDNTDILLSGQNPPMTQQLENSNRRFDAARSIIPGEAKVESYGNTIIVVAEPQVQALYEQLIKELDKRPPQVLIEATVVSIDCSDDYALGIEISSGDRIGARRILSFTSFGLSNVDAAKGALSLIPGIGFNGTLVDPDAADAVLRALANHRRARVVSAPRILVNDNSEGELSSISEVPFTSVNASNTVSTTSFAGFAEAGTSIRVLPNISEGNHVNLDFNVTVNDFSGNGVDGIPPPRQTDDVTSQVTIPDGHTVIVGGLRRRRQSQDEKFLPGLEHLSIFRLLAGNQAKSSGDELLFIFLKPIILRDDKFRDLRFLSQEERQRAFVPNDLPQSGPVLIR